MSHKTVLERFSEITTLHGIKDLYDTSKWICRILWGGVLLIATGILLYSIIDAIRNYSSATVTTSSQIISKRTIQLPSLGICSSAGLNVSKMIAAGLSEELITLMQRYSTQISVNFMKHYSPNSLDTETSPEFNKYVEKYGSVRNVYYEFMFKCEELVTFMRGASCANSQPFLHPSLLYCYNVVTSEQIWPGVDAGVVMILHYPKQSYAALSPAMQFGFGIEIFDRAAPSVSFSPRLLPLNSLVNINLSKKNYQRIQKLDSPKRTILCHNYMKFTARGNCAYECFVNHTTAVCGCVVLGYDFQSNSSNVCTPLQYINCVIPQLGLFTNSSNEVCTQDCRPPCEEVVYQTEITSAPLKLANNLLSSGHQAEVFSYVAMGFSALSYEQIMESDAFPITTLLSNIGGQMGLFLGASVITLIQAVTYFSYSCYHSYKSNNSAQNKTNE